MSKESKRNNLLDHLKQQLEWWEKEGYDVSELRAKWHKELYERESRNKPMTYCSQCGNPVSQNAKFCKACGFEIDSGEVERAQTLETETHPAVNEKPSGVSTTKFSGRSALGRSLIASLIFGILTIISLFLPWLERHCDYSSTSSYWNFSGWDVLRNGIYNACYTSSYDDLYYGAYLVLVFSAIMVTFALLAIVTYKKQGIRRIFVKIVQLGAFVALVASIWSCIYIVNVPQLMQFRYGVTLVIVFSGTGFLALLIADWEIWRHQRSLKRKIESQKNY